jgi:hypothetical protein
MDPATGAIIAAAISAAASGASAGYGARKQKKASKYRSNELRRETYANLLNSAMQGSAELEGQALSGNSQLSQRRTKNLFDTSNVLREAFGI